MPDFGRWTPNGGDPSLNDVNRVDKFFDALGSNGTAYSTDRAEAELAFLLADWRDDVRSAPVTAPVSTGDAVAALNAGLTGRRTRGRASLALVGSVAAAVLCIGGFGAAVFAAGPGDALYGLRSSLFGEQTITRDDAVVLAAQTEMQQVQKLIDDGQWEQAQDKLVALSSTVESVETPEQKQQLVEQFNQLTVKVVEQDPAATIPPDAPLPTFTDSPLTLLPLPTFELPTPTTDPATTTETTPTTPTSPTSETTPTSPTSETTPTSPTSPESSTPGPEVMLSPSSSEPSSVSTPAPSSPSSTPAPSTPASTPAPSSPAPAPSSPTNKPTTTVTRAEEPSQPPSQPSSQVEAPAPAPVERPAPAPAPAPVERPAPAPAPATTEAPAAPSAPVEREAPEPPAQEEQPTTTVVPAG